MRTSPSALLKREAYNVKTLDLTAVLHVQRLHMSDKFTRGMLNKIQSINHTYAVVCVLNALLLWQVTVACRTWIGCLLLNQTLPRGSEFDFQSR